MVWFLFLVVIAAAFVLYVLARFGRGAAQHDATNKPRRQAPRAQRQDQDPRIEREAGRPRRPLPSQPYDIRWFGADATLVVSGFTIQGAGVYASSNNRTGWQSASDPSEILLRAPVRRPTAPAPEMGYWPWYSRIEPENRYEYLHWLASGRRALPSRVGYLFLYYYGLERRLLVDSEDRSWVLQELVKLRKLIQSGGDAPEWRSFRQYSTALLWLEIARTPEQFDRKAFDLVLRLTERWSPELLVAPLAWLASTRTPLPPELAQRIASSDPASQRSVVTKRIPEEFGELFRTRYLESCGGHGLDLKISKRPARHTYRPASGGLDEVCLQTLNPLGIKSQFKGLSEVWNSCITDLRKYSRVSASPTGDEALTIEAWEAMPPELRADTDHPLAGAVGAIVAEHAEADDSGGAEGQPRNAIYTPAGRVAELLGIERRQTLTPSQSRNIATTIEHTGYGIVPDARISAIRYRWDEPVALVPGLDDNDVESARYNAAVCVLRLGLLIAMADGEADDVELRMLTDHIDAVFDLTTEEQRRITVLRELLLQTGSDIRPIARKLEAILPPEARRRVGRLLVVIAAATNGIDRSERAALRKAFRALDLLPELLEETIAEIAPEQDESVVSVKPPTRGAGRGEEIPAAQSKREEFSLNHQAISSILSETREVSALLAEAMGVVEASLDDATGTESVATALGEPSSSTGSAPGPGGRYEPLYRALLAKDRWDRDEADRLAREMGLMLDAGIETMNDWAYDALGAPLIEDEGDELLLDRTLLEDETA